MPEKLKPCPFCGGKAKYFKIKSKAMKSWRFIACLKCGCRTATYPPVDYEISNIVVERWNRRASNENL